jgi:hypothetical protein
MKQKLAVGGAALALMFGAAGVASAAPQDPVRYTSCAEAQKAGVTNIPQSSPLYRRALDRDGDGVACDAKDLAAAPDQSDADDTDLDGEGAQGGTKDDDDRPGHHRPGHDGNDHDGNDHDGNSHDGNGHDGWNHDGGDDDQVDVVPEGGAPTGDGSTEDANGWWIGGGLLAALAAAGVAFRRRLAGLAGR